MTEYALYWSRLGHAPVWFKWSHTFYISVCLYVLDICLCEICLVLLKASHPSKHKNAQHSCVAAFAILLNGFGKIGNPNYIMSFASQWNVPLYLGCKECSPVTEPWNVEIVSVCVRVCGGGSSVLCEELPFRNTLQHNHDIVVLLTGVLPLLGVVVWTEKTVSSLKCPRLSSTHMTLYGA